ncbi:MAG: GDSL-type esterase/lipase family protein [Candidatus Omnitrophota bacterium]
MQNSRQRIILLIFCLAAILASCAKKEIKNIGSRGENIICFGDSITHGYGASTGEDYPTLLSKLAGLSVINAGKEGETTSEALMRLSEDVLERNPLLVIVELGGNDFLHKIPKEVTRENINQIVEKIQARGAMVAITDLRAGLLLREYTPVFKRIAKEKQAIFIPSILSGIITNPHLKSDFLHPNEAGYKLIAERVYGVIKPYLEENSRLKQQ